MNKPGRRGSGKEKEPQYPIAGAVVSGIEAHPRKPQMYRIALNLILEDDREDEKSYGIEAGEAAEGNAGSDWNAEVDALIAGAMSVKQAEETVLTVHEDTLVSRRLLKGKRLSAEEVETLRQDELKEEAYRSALFMLERKARTTAELVQALKRKGYSAEISAACADRLKARRMLDDSAYAKRFTEQRAAGQRKGRMLIRQELLQRGVNRKDVERAIDELDGDVERESALALARKRWPSTKGDVRERKMKLIGMLLRRGFPSGIAKEAARQAAEESEERDSDEEYGEDGFHGFYEMEE